METHVVPRDDSIEHVTLGQTCPCGPDAELLTATEDAGWLYLHAPHDERPREDRDYETRRVA